MRWMSILFLVIGIGLLAGAGMLWRNHANFAVHALRADGTVIDLNYHSSSDGGTYYPEVEFKAANGSVVHISGSTGSNPAAYGRGEHVTVMYPSNNPESGRIDSFSETWLAVLILGGIGLAFALIGGGILFSGLRTRKINDWLAANGLRVQARFENVIYDTSLKINGRSPWRLICQWQHPVTQKVYLFKSANIWFDPTTFVKRDTLDVLVDMDNPKRYQVDISFLPEAG